MSESQQAAVSGQTFNVRVITPKDTVFDGPVTRMVVSSLVGRMELLPRHEATMAPLAIAPMELYLPDDEETAVPYAVLGGFLDHNGTEAVILADGAEKGSEIDVARAQEALRRAKERLDEVSRQGDPGTLGVDTDRARLALLRSLVRLQASGHPHAQG